MTLTATIEQAKDGSWTAVAHIGEHTVLGDGDSRSAAISSFREGAESMCEYLKAKGERLPELVTVEIAA